MKPGFATNVTAAFFAILFVAPVAWMALDRDPPYIRESGAIEPSEPIQGGDVSVNWKVKVKKSCPPSTENNLTRMIVDAKGKRHFYDPIPSVYGQRTPSRIKRTLPLPDDIAVGPAKYSSEACFACNPFQYIWPVCIGKPDLTFEIYPR